MSAIAPMVGHADAVKYWEILQLDKRIRNTRNQIDYFDILSTFWPFGNMQQRMERLQKELQQLEREKIRLQQSLH